MTGAADGTPMRLDGTLAVLATRSRVLWIVVGVGLVVGAALRLHVLRGPAGVLDSDEAVVGLMALRTLHGDPSAFYWGQSYGGTLEVLLTTPLLLFGPSAWALKAVPIALWLVASGLMFRLLTELGRDRAVAASAAIALWCWPLVIVQFSTRARGFYGAILVLFLLGVLILNRLDRALDERRGTGASLLLPAAGGVAGLMWWTAPFALHLLLPAGLVYGWRLVTSARKGDLLRGCAAFFLGSMPWWMASGWRGLSALETDRAASASSSIGDRLDAMFGEGIPTVLGLMIHGRYIVPLGALLTVALVAVITVSTAGHLVRRRAVDPHRRRTVKLLVGVLVCFPVVYVMNPLSHLIGEARYLLLLVPSVLLLAAAALPRRVQIGLSGALVVLSGIGLGHLALDPQLAPDVPIPDDLHPVVEYLESAGVRHAFADYWIAYRLTFETGERILATSTSLVRSREHDEAVRSASRVAHVAVEGSNLTGWSPDLDCSGGAPELVGGFSVRLFTCR